MQQVFLTTNDKKKRALHQQLLPPRVPCDAKADFHTTTLGIPGCRSGPRQLAPYFTTKEEKYLQHLILKPSAREHSCSDSSRPWKQTSRSISNPAHVSGCPLCCAVLQAALSPALPSPSATLKANLLAKTKNCTCKSWGGLLWKPKLQNIQTHEYSGQTSI